MSKQPEADHYSDEETARRRDDALRRALSTPPKPHKAKPNASNTQKIEGKRKPPG